MVQVEVMIQFEGKIYLTNVIADNSTPDEEIQRMAYEQVQKQWKKLK
ncbi:BA3454 family stress response protein [Neobacillus dielmonensis]|nr:BA3454 family stress response protein [Neobacillus dielmonensis]